MAILQSPVEYHDIDELRVCETRRVTVSASAGATEMLSRRDAVIVGTILGPAMRSPSNQGQSFVSPSQAVLAEFADYYNHERPHRQPRAAESHYPDPLQPTGRVVARSVLGGLHLRWRSLITTMWSRHSVRIVRKIRSPIAFAFGPRRGVRSPVIPRLASRSSKSPLGLAGRTPSKCRPHGDVQTIYTLEPEIGAAPAGTTVGSDGTFDIKAASEYEISSPTSAPASLRANSAFLRWRLATRDKL